MNEQNGQNGQNPYGQNSNPYGQTPNANQSPNPNPYGQPPNQSPYQNPYPNPMPMGGMMPMGANGPISESEQYLIDMKNAQKAATSSRVLALFSIVLSVIFGVAAFATRNLTVILSLIVSLICLFLGIFAISKAVKSEKISYIKEAKMGKLLGIFGAIISAVVAGFCFYIFVTETVDLLKVKEEDFVIKNEIKVTMTSDYKHYPAFSSSITEVYAANKDSRMVIFTKQSLDGLNQSGLAFGNMSAADWRDLYFEQEQVKNQYTVKRFIDEDGIVGAEATFRGEDIDGEEQSLKTFTTFYKSGESIWVISFATLNDKYDEHRDEFFDFAHSIKNSYT
jgi:hypothetical protein